MRTQWKTINAALNEHAKHYTIVTKDIEIEKLFEMTSLLVKEFDQLQEDVNKKNDKINTDEGDLNPGLSIDLLDQKVGEITKTLMESYGAASKTLNPGNST